MRKSAIGFSLVLASALTAAGQAPAVSPGGVVNGASFSIDQPDKRVAPGSLISIFGTNLASGIALADSIPVSTALGDVSSVTFNGVAAPILSVSTGQINVQLPWELVAPVGGTSNVSVVVTRKTAGASAPVETPIGQYSPGIFTAPASGTGQAFALIYPDNAIAAPSGSIPGRATRPAKPGDILQIYATGLGPVTDTPQDGAAPAGAPATLVKPVILIGGIAALPVQFSGLAPGFVGLYQVNVEVPANAPAGDAVALQIQIGGMTSTAKATIAIAAP
jgi:uncharacterized protein (TIGR03437 family)